MPDDGSARSGLFLIRHIVSDLNEKGFRTREGKPWRQSGGLQYDAPDLLKWGRALFHSEEWKTRQQRL